MIASILQAEAGLLTRFPGGVSRRFPQSGNGYSATPTLFYGIENPKEHAKLKPVVVVLDGGDNPSPGAGARNGYVEFPQVYGYATDDDEGRENLAWLGGILHLRFDRTWYLRNDNRPIEFLTLERQAEAEGDDFGFPDRIFSIWRIQATYVHTIGE
jgi:hypothetical protein